MKKKLLFLILLLTNIGQYLAKIPLHVAVKKGDQFEVEKILKYNPGSVNKPDQYGIVPLMHAIVRNNKNIAKLLIENGANVNTKYQQEDIFAMPIFLAIEFSFKEILELLLENNANVDIQDKKGNRPLHLAIAKKNKKFVKLLLKYGANVNAQDKDGNTPLHIAIFNNNKEIARLLINSGADTSIKDKSGSTPLRYAIVYSQGIAIILLKKYCVKKVKSISSLLKNSLSKVSLLS